MTGSTTHETAFSIPKSLGLSPQFAEAGYIFVYQDARGRWMSEGEFDQMRPHRPKKDGPGGFDESSDTWDTVDWLVTHVSNWFEAT